MLKISLITFFVFSICCLQNAFSQRWGEELITNAIENFDSYLEEATKDSTNNNPGTTFISTCLRNFPEPKFAFPDIYAKVTDGPKNEDCEIQLRCALEKRGFSGPYFNASELKTGDIVFTESLAPYEGELWPTHAFFFVEWFDHKNTDFAYILDYHGAYIKRNITTKGEYVKFQYFMRSPFEKDYTTNTEINKENEIKIFPNPVKGQLNLIKNFSSKKQTISIYSQTGLLVFTEKTNGIQGEIHKINLSKFHSGIYFIKVSIETETLKPSVILNSKFIIL